MKKEFKKMLVAFMLMATSALLLSCNDKDDDKKDDKQIQYADVLTFADGASLYGMTIADAQNFITQKGYVLQEIEDEDGEMDTVYAAVCSTGDTVYVQFDGSDGKVDGVVLLIFDKGNGGYREHFLNVSSQANNWMVAHDFTFAGYNLEYSSFIAKSMNYSGVTGYEEYSDFKEDFNKLADSDIFYISEAYTTHSMFSDDEEDSPIMIATVLMSKPGAQAFDDDISVNMPQFSYMAGFYITYDADEDDDDLAVKSLKRFIKAK